MDSFQLAQRVYCAQVHSRHRMVDVIENVEG